MDALVFKGIRCFPEQQTARLKPVTLLTGENSTGKTTVLALARLAWELCQGNLAPDFNEEPFVLGSYDEIASFRGGRGGRARSFTIGAQLLGPPGRRARVIGYFTKRGAQPALKRWTLEVEDFRLEVEHEEGGKQPRWRLETASGPVVITHPPFPAPQLPVWLFFDVLRSAKEAQGLRDFAAVEGKAPDAGEIKRMERSFLRALGSLGVRPNAFAPIRTRPRRTYDPVRDVPEPEGSHVPMVLAKLSSSAPEEWAHLHDALDAFGKESGLFSDVEVRRMGRRESGPFQVRVRISGPPANLVDVGYGVSQVLPIVVDALRGPKGSTYLLQQPEVHLHPKAQAELASFLAILDKQQKKRFVIETHSDHLVDRIRMEVREGKVLKAQDVALLYFERRDGGVRIQELELDMFGNIVDPPEGYRQFFLEEERRLLGG